MEFTLARALLDQKAPTHVKEKPEPTAFVRHVEALLLTPHHSRPYCK
jgi:hypothetical protein